MPNPKNRQDFLDDPKHVDQAFRGKNMPPPLAKQIEMRQPKYCDSLFISGFRELQQWSVRQDKVIKEYGNIMARIIYSMVKTSYKKYLLLSDREGC
jgi:hypothetical protein